MGTRSVLQSHKFPGLGLCMPVHKTKKPVKAKTGTQTSARKNGKQPIAKTGRSAKPGPPSPSAEAKAQYTAFERGIALLHKRNFRDAKEMFEKARRGPSAQIAVNAPTHVRMCARRLAAPAPDPKSAEARYNYAIPFVNFPTLPPPRPHLPT